MAMSYKGGVISATAPTTSAGGAPGSWTLKQQMQAIGSSLWTGIPDAYYKYVSLLLPGNGTNGAQNNTFLDSSTNNFTITRNGNTTQGTFAPYGSNWSNYFDGSGDYLTVPSNAAFDMGSGNFTIEVWVYHTSFTGNQIYTTRANNGSTYPTFEVGLYSSTVQLYASSSGSTYNINLASSIAPTLNAWTHVAVTRNGSTYTIWVNGVSGGTATSALSLVANGNSLGVGGYPDGANPMKGYLSNVRIVKDTAVYTAAFTPPTAPLTAISGTSLLTCQSNRFIDNSSNAFTITRNGDTSVQRFSPFSPTTYYAPDAVGGSGYFDGSGDYLTVGSNAALGMGTGDFTVELWFYYTATPSNEFLFDFRYASGSLLAAAAGTFGVDVYVGAGNRSGGTVTVNNWYHLAVTRSGSTCYVFLNGAQIGATFSDSTNLATGGISIASRFNVPTQVFPGYISNFRVVKGTAVYTAAFTPPTAPLTAITNTSLLLSGTNAAIIDNAMMNNLETVGNAQTSTTQSKWGGSSMSFNGTTDYLVGRSTDLASFGTGDFTIEGWVYPSAVTGTDRCLWDTRAAAGDSGMVLFIDTNGKLSTYTSAALRITSTNSLSANTWQHFALCRSSGTMAFYINGTQNGTLSYSTAITCPGRISIATRYDNAAFYTGYIDDLRITKGYARYTATFTPPAGPFTPN